MSRLLDWLCAGIEAILAVCMVGMVVLVFGNVVLRYGFNASITVSDELSRWMFIWMTFLGAALAFKEHAHLGIDVLVSKLPPAGRFVCLLASYAGMLYICVLMFQGSLVQTQINWYVSAPTTGLPLAFVHAAGVAFAVLSFLFLALDLMRMALNPRQAMHGGMQTRAEVIEREIESHTKPAGGRP